MKFIFSLLFFFVVSLCQGQVSFYTTTQEEYLLTDEGEMASATTPVGVLVSFEDNYAKITIADRVTGAKVTSPIIRDTEKEAALSDPKFGAAKVFYSDNFRLIYYQMSNILFIFT